MIRRANKNDIDQMAILWGMMIKECFPESSPNLEWWKQYTNALIESDIYYALVAEIDGVIVGFLDGILYPDPASGKSIAMGHSFFVMPECRHSNASFRLYRAGLELAKNKAIDTVEINISAHNIGMWSTKGFKFDKYSLRRCI